jgi:uncharacterized protein involved in exopolysaccharide biosynthesis
MTDSFDPIEYLEYLRARWKFTAIAVLLAGATAVALCLMLPKQYTAVATLVIEPPGGDPRSSTAVSSIYLESLKSYEAFASSDTLFAKACEKFHLLDLKSGPLESFKRRVLRVDKLKDTTVLEVSVTLPDPIQAQALVQYLAQETVALDRDIVRTGDQAVLDNTRQQLEGAQKELQEARAEMASIAGSEPVLDSEVQSLQERKANAEAQRVDANMTLAASSVREGQESTAADRAGLATLTADIAAMQRDLDTKSAAVAVLRARRQRGEDRLRTAEEVFERAAKRGDEAAASVMFRTEQLRIVDPGIVPERPSFPNLPLVGFSAVAIAATLCLVWLTLQFGLRRPHDQPVRAGLRVAGSGGR